MSDHPKNSTDWARVDAMTDEDIAAQIADDPDVAPECDAAWFRRARWVYPPYPGSNEKS